jgi:predicted nucleic acid-binding protein
MILVDTSAWIGLLRATGHPVHVTLRHHLERRSPIGTTEPVIMELLAGTRRRRDHSRLRMRLIALPRLSVRGLSDFESAADLYRTCRGGGVTVRKLIDCLIAAIAIRENATLLHNDRDFEVLARHTRLRTESYRTLRPVSSR